MLNIGMFFWIQSERPEYLKNYRLNQNGDASHYVNLGRNFLQYGDYTRSYSIRPWPDSFRTPGYPIFAGGFDLLGGAGMIYTAQIVLHFLSCILLGWLGTRLFGRTTGFVAGMLCGTDLTLVVANFEAMSEPLYFFLLVLVLSATLPTVVEPRQMKVSLGIVIGLLIGVTILVRPAGLYLPAALALVLVLAGFSRKSLIHSLQFCAAILAGCSLCIVPWIVRNWLEFDIPHLTTNDSIVLVYFLGAGAYQIEHGLTLKEAQDRIADEFHLQPPTKMWNDWDSEVSAKEMDDAARKAIPAILSRYPRSLLKSSLLGIVKATVSHNVGTFAGILGREWHSPGTGPLLKLDPKAFANLLSNGSVLTVMFFWQLAFATALFALSWIACARLIWRVDCRLLGFVFFILLIFFTATLGASGLEAFWRFRIPIHSIAYLLVGTLTSLPPVRMLFMRPATTPL